MNKIYIEVEEPLTGRTASGKSVKYLLYIRMISFKLVAKALIGIMRKKVYRTVRTAEYAKDSFALTR